MATAAAALYTSLTLESSSFNTNLKRAATAAEQTSAQISRSLTAAKSAVVGFLSVASAGVAVATVNRALQYAASIGETSQQLGIAAKKYQELTYAATQQGVAQGDLETGLARLTRTIGKGSEAFDKLGIATKDANGNSRATGDVFDDIAAALGKIQDPAKRAALEVELFGKSGQKLDTLLAGGTAAIAAMADEAARLGLVLSPEQIKNADAAADAFARVKHTLEVNIAGTVATNAKAIEGLANGLGKLITKAGELATWVTNHPKLAGTLLGAGYGALVGGPFGAGAGAVAGFIGGAELEASLKPAFNGARGQGAKARAAAEKAAAAASAGVSLDDAPAKITNVAKAATVALKPVKDFSDALWSLGASSIAGEGGVSALFKTDDQIYNDTVSKLFELGDLAAEFQPIELIDQQALDRIDAFGKKLSESIGQAVIYSGDFWGGMLNGAKALAAELVTSSIYKLFSAGASSGGFIGSALGVLGGLFGGARAKGGPVSSGKGYLVGERGPEFFSPGTSGHIIPNGAMNDMGRRDAAAMRVEVNVSPSPLFITSAHAIATKAGAEAAGGVIAGVRRQAIPRGRG